METIRLREKLLAPLGPMVRSPPPVSQKKALRLKEVPSNLPEVTQTVGAKDINSVY